MIVKQKLNKQKETNMQKEKQINDWKWQRITNITKEHERKNKEKVKGIIKKEQTKEPNGTKKNNKWTNLQ